MKKMPEDLQIAAIVVLDYVAILFGSSPRMSFSKDEILVLLNRVKNDPCLFDEDSILKAERLSKEVMMKETER